MREIAKELSERQDLESTPFGVSTSDKISLMPA
jgi:hypothetical protein